MTKQERQGGGPKQKNKANKNQTKGKEEGGRICC